MQIVSIKVLANGFFKLFFFNEKKNTVATMHCRDLYVFIMFISRAWGPAATPKRFGFGHRVVSGVALP